MQSASALEGTSGCAGCGNFQSHGRETSIHRTASVDLHVQERVGSLDLYELGLTSLAGLGTLAEVDALGLTALQIKDLTGLEHVAIGTLGIGYNEKLTRLDGLTPAIQRLSALTLQSNPLLDDLRALGALQRITDGLSVTGNDALSSLAGLEQLSQVASLGVSDNAHLTSLTALQSLTAAPTLRIMDNPLLPTCQAQGLADRLGDEPQAVSVSGNLAGGTCD